ncbi:MAG: hypothetical protein FWC21_00520 [Treponema sp.]|nr:hypothetical protein [Treponema sp.]
MEKDESIIANDARKSGIRPNANYQLSYPDTDEVKPENITFYYNREKRLANAPKEVKDLYSDQKKSRFGLLGSLVADRPRKILFFMILLLCILIFLLSRLGFLDDTYIFDGNNIEITGAIFEGNTIIFLKKTINNALPYTGAVDIAVSPSMDTTEENNLTDFGLMPYFAHRVFFSLENIEEYRFVVPYDSAELLIILQNDKNEQLRMIINPR